MPLPYLAPIMAIFLNAKPAPPPGLRGLLIIIVLVALTLGIGLLLIPVIQKYPFSALLMIGLGLYCSMYLTINIGKQMVGTLLIVGLTMIPAAGTVHAALAQLVIIALAASIIISVICMWLVYPLFPEDSIKPQAPEEHNKQESNWAALRATLIVIPPFLLALNNPSTYMPLIMKSVMLGQQGSIVSTRSAGRELVGSTFLAGILAVLFWAALDLHESLWFFFCLMLLFSIYITAKLYRVFATRFPPSFWLNAAVTMLILIGPAVQDSAGGKDVYINFLMRISFFIALSLYAWFAISILDLWQKKYSYRNKRKTEGAIATC